MRSIFRKTWICAFAVMAMGLAFREATANSEAEVSATAQRFFDDYNKSVLSRGMGYEESIAWVTKNPLATPEYKTALALGSTSITSGKILSIPPSATAFTGTMANIVLSGNAAYTGTLLKSSVTGTSGAAVPIMVSNLSTGLSLRVNDATRDADTTPFVVDAAAAGAWTMTLPTGAGRNGQVLTTNRSSVPRTSARRSPGP